MVSLNTFYFWPLSLLAVPLCQRKRWKPHIRTPWVNVDSLLDCWCLPAPVGCPAPATRLGELWAPGRRTHWAETCKDISNSCPHVFQDNIWNLGCLFFSVSFVLLKDAKKSTCVKVQEFLVHLFVEQAKICVEQSQKGQPTPWLQHNLTSSIPCLFSTPTPPQSQLAVLGESDTASSTSGSAPLWPSRLQSKSAQWTAVCRKKHRHEPRKLKRIPNQ